MLENNGVKIYQTENVCVVEFNDVRIVDQSVKQWVMDNSFGQYGYEIDVIVHKKCHYIITPEAMKLAAHHVRRHVGRLVLCGSEKRPDPDDNFATRTYLAGKKVDVCSSLAEGIRRIRDTKRLSR